MEIDLTVRSSDGVLRDVRLQAAEGTPDTDLLAAIGADVGDVRHGAIVGPGVAGRAEPATWRIAVCGGPDAGRTIALATQRIVVGRADDADLALTDPGVSRRHVELTARGGRVLVRDLGSRNGCTLDGTPIGGGTVELGEGALLRLGDTMLRADTAATTPADTKPLPDKRILVNPAPTPGPADEPPVIDLPAPPQAARPMRVQWLAALLPALGAAALAYWMGSAMFLLLAALSPLALLAGAASDRWHGRRSRRREVADYRTDLAAASDLVEAALAAEQRARRAELPDPVTVADTAVLPGRALWSRARGPGLLTVRVGLGTAGSLLRTRTGGVLDVPEPVADVPIAVDLQDGPLGVAGPVDVAAATARWCVLQAAVAVGPSDLQIVPLVEGAAWEWLRWLPHLGAPVADDPAGRRAIVRGLAGTVAEREQSRYGNGGWDGPWTLVVLDEQVDRRALGELGEVLTRGAAVGVTAVCVHTRAAGLPASCAATAQIRGSESGGGTRVDVQGRDPAEGVADGLSLPLAERAARALAPLVDPRDTAGWGLPGVCSLGRVLGEDDPARYVRAAWAADDGTPVAAVGVTADGTVEIDLARDGPHALVAGTTGSGKSELLRTWVLSLAARHAPDTVQFLFIDYKGGAAFAECADLPHCAGLVTDLDTALVRRALVSLRAELRRREELFAAVGASDLAEYRRLAPEPCPRLVIVVDEFAGLVEELPDFVTGLVGIAQRGRSLGVHLILATQRPGGVVSPEIRANTALRIALRVTGAGDSAEVLDSPVAARLSPATPGRAYIRRADELLAVQVAGSSVRQAEQADGVRVVELDRWRRAAPDVAELPPPGPSPLSDWVGAIRAAAGTAKAGALWRPPLPEDLTLEDLPDPPPGSVAIGLVDLPDEQRQVPYQLDLDRAGAVLVCGGPRSGRSSTLRALAAAATARWRPDELHVHALDCGGALADLARLPHAGTVAGADQPELIDVLLRRLDLEVRDRLSRRRTGRLPRLLLLVDGWEALDDTETLESLVRSGAAAGLTVVIAGDRDTLAPRVSGTIPHRLVLPLADPADYALAGVPARSVPTFRPPGRALTPEGHEVQLARPPGELPPVAGGSPPPGLLRLRPLPHEVDPADLPRPRLGTAWLGIGGDTARPVGFDPFIGAGRLLVAGPSRSGRSSVLRTIAAQRPPGVALVVAASHRSPLARLDGAATMLSPESPATALEHLDGPTLLLVDDCEAFLDTEIGDALATLIRSGPDGPGGLAAVVAGRNDALAVTHRGLPVEARRFGCGVLLQPGPLDGELVSAPLARGRPGPRVPGRGVLVPDPGWPGFADADPLPVQIAASRSSSSWLAYQDSSNPSASSTASCADSSPRSAASIAVAAAATVASASASSMWMDAT